MDSSPLPPPTRPDFETQPRGSWLAILLALIAAVAFAVILTFLTLGFVWPFVVGFFIFGIIGLQYLAWGWWLGRMYKNVELVDEEPLPASQFSLGELMLALSCFSLGLALIIGLPSQVFSVSQAGQAMACLIAASFGAGIGALRHQFVLGALLGAAAGLIFAIGVAVMHGA